MPFVAVFLCRFPNRGTSEGLGGCVSYYRLYLLDSSDGRFVGFEEIEAADDVEAVRIAERHEGPQPLELWCGKKKVKSFPAKVE